MSDPSLLQHTALGAIPLAFESRAGWCFGWHHPARGARRNAGVVLCRPVGYEAICAWRSYTMLAEGLAQDGFDVLRFDYHGTGDSCGGDADPQRVSAWQDSIVAAAGELRRVSGVAGITLFGVRLGAMLASRAAAAMGGVDNLVLWAPCSGRAFGRELRVACAARGHDQAAGGDIEALGYPYTAQTLQDLAALDRQPYPVVPARRALVIARDDMPADPGWAATLDGLGVQATSVQWPGYAAMMVEPLAAVIALETLARIREWLRAAAPVAPRTAPSQRVETCRQWFADGVREQPVLFGPGAELFGILAEPAQATSTVRADTALLLLNVGGDPHIGPSRNYVRFARELAAAGYRTFRLDLRCIGDSAGVAEFDASSLYSPRSCVADVQAAIDTLAQRGCKRFYLVGICSGSYAAFQTTLVDARVTGQILMNSRLLDWERGRRESTLESSMHHYNRSSAWYLRELLNPRVYWRLLRGEVHVGRIAKRFATLFAARVTRGLDRLLRRGELEQELVGRFRRFSARGTDSLMIMAEADDGRDYVELHLGKRGARLQDDPNFRMVLVPDADHTFSSTLSQQRVIEVMREHLERRMAAPTAGSEAGFLGARVLPTRG